MSKILGVHIPTEIKNLAINGAFDFGQRYENNTYTVSGSTTSVGAYVADMWVVTTGGSNGKSYTMARSTNIPSVTQSGFESTYSYIFTNTVAGGFATNDYYEPFLYKMEGLDYEKIHAKNATYGFWFNPSLAGTYSFAIRNQAASRSYVTTFTASVGWQFIAITVPMDNTTSWNFDNTLGMQVDIGAITGATFSTSVLNTWQTGNYFSATTSTNYVASAGNSISLAQFSIVEGTLGFGPTGFQRAGKSIAQELAMCQRYYEKSYDIGTLVGTATFSGCAGGPRPSGAGRTGVRNTTWYKVTKRVPGPAIQTYNPQVTNAGSSYYDGDGGGVVTSFAEANSNMFTFGGTSGTTTTGNPDRWHWTSDAGL